MRPQIQLHRGGTGVPGDCYRTCLAMVLDMDRDAVPHFCEHVPIGAQPGNPEFDASDRWELEWLATHGLAKVVIPHPGDSDVWEIVEHYGQASDVAAILQTSLYGEHDHAVVLYRGRLYDPLDLNWTQHLAGSVRYQPSTHGFFWVTILARQTNPLTYAEDPATVVTKEHN